MVVNGLRGAMESTEPEKITELLKAWGGGDCLGSRISERGGPAAIPLFAISGGGLKLYTRSSGPADFLRRAIIYLTYRTKSRTLEAWAASRLFSRRSSTSPISRTANGSWFNCAGLTAQ